MIVLVLIAVLAFTAIYSPQPLLPPLAETFDIPRSQAALLMTVLFLPLSVAPITYGYLLESIPTVKVLRYAVLGLAIATFAFGLANSFTLLLVIRFIQGLMIPAIMTATMTYISTQAKGQQMQRMMSLYIAGGIAGGYFGRLLAGLTATYVEWSLFFLALGIALMIAFFMLRSLPEAQATSSRAVKFDLTLIRQGMAYWQIYLIIFCMFYALAAIMTFIPFRLVDLLGNPSEALTGLIYMGHLTGMFTSMGSQWVIARLGNERLAIIVAIGVYLGALVLFMIPSVWALFGVLFIFCGAMFLGHATEAGWLNQMAAEGKGMANGLYVAFYYTGGMLGSYLPGLLYESYGWHAFIISLMVVVAVAGVCAYSLQFAPSSAVAREGVYTKIRMGL